jgi:endoglucanase
MGQATCAVAARCIKEEMDPARFFELAGRLMRCPAAPGHETAVRTAAEQICAEHSLPFTHDPFGNLLVGLQTDPRPRPLALAAHLDHPGFEMLRQLSPNLWLARFLGGVPDCFFRRGLPLRLMPGATAATLGRRCGQGKQFEIRTTNSDFPSPEFAVWELEDCAVRREHIFGRSCDDLIGVASVLATLIELQGTRSRVNVIGVISRAEEVGFHGALTVAASRRLPKNSLVISLETSRELPPVKMGQGVVIRVGDRTSIFDSEATRFLSEVADGLSAKQKSFQWQRALMSGGTCEATAYQEFGFQTAAVCIALGNYHNCGEGGQIAAEFVSMADACGMVRLLVEAARQTRSYSKLVGRLPHRLVKLLKTAQESLRAPV